MGIQVTERPIDKSELIIADEVFLCGTAAKVVPVNRIENYELSQHRPITQKLQEKFVAITENRESKYQDWVFPISIV